MASVDAGTRAYGISPRRRIVAASGLPSSANAGARDG